MNDNPLIDTAFCLAPRGVSRQLPAFVSVSDVKISHHQRGSYVQRSIAGGSTHP
jgi:hypothetical protein